MKLKLIYFTDAHIRGNNPRSRVDNFPDALKSKFREIFNLATNLAYRRYGSTPIEDVAIVCGGDLFDRPDPMYAVFGEFASVLAKSPVPIYVVPGNHEIYGYNLETLPRTALGVLSQVGLVKILTREPEILKLEWARAYSGGLQSVTVELTGQGFYNDIDRNPLDYQPPERTYSESYQVHVVHGMLVDKPLPYEVAHTLVDDVVTTADVILSGHEHLGYGLKQRGDTWFCNPGALSRMSAKVEEMHRPVQVAVFTFSEDGIEAELVPLMCAAPGSEVLSRDHLVEAAESEERMNRFLNLLAREGESKFLEVREIVDGIAKKEKLPKAVVNEALDRIAKAREALGVRSE
ncbi:MAG: metallophosphoesterase family protein [Thermincolia bacterium]